VGLIVLCVSWSGGTSAPVTNSSLFAPAWAEHFGYWADGSVRQMHIFYFCTYICEWDERCQKKRSVSRERLGRVAWPMPYIVLPAKKILSKHGVLCKDYGRVMTLDPIII
jgi:hypothetical protein